MSILIMRPKKDADALCLQLEDNGLVAFSQPLIEITPIPLSRLSYEKIQQADIIIAVSQHAVESLAEADLNDIWPKKAIYLAVGQKSGLALQQSSHQSVHYPEQADSEHLLRLPPLQDVCDKQILILRGNGGRELIQQTLLRRGARVSYCETYTRHYHSISNSCVKTWMQNRVETLVITSSEQLTHLVTSIPKSALNWLFQRRLIVPSERIQQQALQYGFLLVVSTGSAANNVIVQHLSQQD